MRKIIRSIPELTGKFLKYSLPAHINNHGMNKSEWKEYHATQRVEKKLLYLKRATLLSYISICCTQELTASLALETKDRLIDYLICNGHGQDCATAYEVR